MPCTMRTDLIHTVSVEGSLTLYFATAAGPLDRWGSAAYAKQSAGFAGSTER